MKKKYPVEKIEAGTTFTADVYVDAQNLLVPAGEPVRAKDLEGLKQWGILYVYSEGDQVDQQQGKAKAQANVKKGLAAFSDHKLYAEYASMVDRLKIILDKIAAVEKIEPKIVDKLAQEVLGIVRYRDA